MNDLEGEVWVPIFRKYAISNMGRVRSLKRNVHILMKQYLVNSGYYTVHFRVANRRIAKTVHRLVADIFLKNIDPKKITVNHEFGKEDNRSTSLSWMTQVENSVHAVNNGLLPKGTQSYLAKLDETQVKTIKSIGKSITQQQLSSYFKVSRTNIYNILSGISWKHITV